MKYQIIHKTCYTTTSRVSVCHNAAWLTPRRTPHQEVLEHSLVIDPDPSTCDTHPDYFGNPVTHFSLNHGYEKLMVTTSSIVVVQAERPADVQTPWEKVLEQIQSHSTPADLDSLQFCFDSPRSHRSSEAAAFAQKCFSPGRPIVKSVMDLTSLVFEEFQYDPKATTVTTPVSEVLQQRRGVCQDFAHVQIAMLRSLGLAARYVSGYVRTYPKPGQPRLIGVDASHAWLSVYCGDVGWIDVDPTNNKLVGDEYITLGWGRDYGDVTPLKGVFTGGGKHSLDVSVDVAPLDE